MSCNCKSKSSCTCGSILGGSIVYDGLGFKCVNEQGETVFEFNSGDSANYIWELLGAQICALQGGEVEPVEDGSRWFADSPVPSDTLGNDNDFYLRTFNGDVYTKASGSWGSPIINLEGPSGSDGADGKSFLTGSGVPNAALGNDGDSYGDLASTFIDIYTKGGGIWTNSGVKFKGATGANGADGTNGTNGTNGTDGQNFFQGIGVPNPTLGVDGDSYLDSTNGDLYLKSAGVWSITGNIYAAPAGLEFLFNAAKITEQTITGPSSKLVLTFADDVSAGRYDYGNSWITDTWTNPADQDDISFRGIFNLKVTGVDGVLANDVTVTVKKNGGSIGVATITVPAGTLDDTIIPLSFSIPSQFFLADDIVNVELSTGAGAEYNNFVGVAQIGDVFYNVEV